MVGAHGSGKSTLLRLLGHKTFPKEGAIFIPTHLRILHVSQQPMLLGLSAWRNLVFGRPHATPSRVKAICEELGMPQTLEMIRKELGALCATETGRSRTDTGWDNFHNDQPDIAEDNEEDDKQSDDDSDEENWQERLSSTEIAKIHLARALIMNPEVMVLHRPLYSYDTPVANNIVRIISKHVENRGFHLSEDGRARRRPRTVFFTPTSLDQAEKADIVWRVTDSKTVEPIDKTLLHMDFGLKGLDLVDTI